MSDTNVQTVNENALVDLFPGMNLGTAPGAAKFGMIEGDANLFPSTGDTTTLAPASTTDTTTASTTDTTTLKDEADMFGTSSQEAPKPASAGTITDLASYYQDRIKSGKFLQVDFEDENGVTAPFIPKTPEEYDQVLDIQLEAQAVKIRKEIETKWYESKSPAWKAISQYAELVDDPTQLIPFIQGVRTLQSVAGLDENTPEGAEEIVRTRLTQKGDPEEIIKSQLDSLKTTDNLIKTAKQYKPLILQQEQAILSRDMKEKQENERRYLEMLADIRDNAIKSIEKPLFGKTKLKQEEKAAIYDLIGEQDEQSQGYKIYSVIDNLFATKDFETLKELALMLHKKEAFYNYLGINAANQTAASLEKKLKLAGDSRTASGNNFDEENRVVIKKNQFNTKPSFGRG